jgi:GR25 family glycosyltransferase involved in LPS biosynthesis
MSSISLFDIPIYCINLDSRQDRWNNLYRRLKSYGLTKNLIRKSAVKPSEVTLPFSSYLKPAQKACAQSHIELWKAFIDSKEEYILILEDDVCFRKDWVKILQDRLSTLEAEHPGWRALFLNVSEESVPYNTWNGAHRMNMTGAILYSRRGVETLLSMFGPGSDDKNGLYYASDKMTYDLQYKALSYTYFPWLAIQDGSLSDLQDGLPDADFQKVVRLLKEANVSLDIYDI